MESNHNNVEAEGPAENPAPRELLALVEKTPFRSLAYLLDDMVLLAAVRKSSKSVSSHWMLDIIEISEPRTLALTASLYLENFMEQHLRQESLSRRRKPLAIEINKMASSGYINNELRDDMQAIVKLRNEFAHNLFYDISEWDPLTSPFLAKHPPRMPVPRYLRRVKNLVVLKILLMSILFRLHSAFPWLTFQDVPKEYRKRPTKSLQPAPRFERSR